MTTQETRELLDTAKLAIETTVNVFERATGLQMRIDKYYGGELTIDAKIETTVSE